MRKQPNVHHHSRPPRCHFSRGFQQRTQPLKCDGHVNTQDSWKTQKSLSPTYVTSLNKARDEKCVHDTMFAEYISGCARQVADMMEKSIQELRDDLTDAERKRTETEKLWIEAYREPFAPVPVL